MNSTREFLRVALKNLGCKVNQAEGRELLAGLPAGFKVVNAREKAEVYLINTCTVTEVADRKSRQAIRQLKKQNPRAKMVVLGCGARGERPTLEGLPEMDFLEADLGKVAGYLRKVERDWQEMGKLKPARRRGKVRELSVEGPSEADLLSPTRTVVKVQDGCNNFCTYCIVPLKRGRSRGRPVKEILAEIKRKGQAGFKEIVLSGINLGTYQDDTVRLADLMELILAKTKIPRIRLSSLQPQNFSVKFLRVFRDERLCPHLHLSLQSGSEKILRKMGRPYTAQNYRSMVERLEKIKPDLALTTDIIVGFPGETEKDFEDNVKLARQVGFSKIHVFSYSPRPGTKAADFDEEVPVRVKQQRSQALRELSDKLGLKFRRREVGKTRLVLFEEKKGDFWLGFTENYLKVRVDNKASLRNQICSVKLTRVFSAQLMEGELVADK